MITRVERTFRHDGIVENLYTSLNFVRNYENEHILSTSLEYKYNTNVKKHWSYRYNLFRTRPRGVGLSGQSKIYYISLALVIFSNYTL